MAGVLIEIKTDENSVLMAFLKKLSDFEDRKRGLFEDIGSTVTENIRERWTRGEGLNGRWPLSVRVMREGGTTLRKTSRLMNSITYNATDNGLEIGTDAEYGAIHHFGGVIDMPARTRTLHFRQDGRTGLVGNRFVRQSRSNFAQDVQAKAYKVNMPERPWLGITDDDVQDIVNLVEGTILDE